MWSPAPVLPQQVYDLTDDEGWVGVGDSAGTSEFAVKLGPYLVGRVRQHDGA